MKNFQKRVQLIIEATAQDNFFRALYAAVHAKNAAAISELLVNGNEREKKSITSRTV